MLVEAAHDSLNDVVQALEYDRCRRLHRAPDQGIAIPEFDANGDDFVETAG